MVGVDPRLISLADARILLAVLNNAFHSLYSVTDCLIDIVGTHAQVCSLTTVRVIPLEFSGKACVDKISQVRAAISEREEDCWGFCLTKVDEIAWLVNVQVCDVENSNQFFVYALVTLSNAFLYVHESQLTEGACVSLDDNDVELRPYEALMADLKSFKLEHITEFLRSSKFMWRKQKLWLDPCCWLAIQDAIGGPTHVIEDRSPIIPMKVIKNETELQGIREAHIRDAASICQLFAWLDGQLATNHDTSLTKLDVSMKLDGFRRKQASFLGSHSPANRVPLQAISRNEIYLSVTNARYMDGTASCTRSFHFSTSSAFDRESHTRALQGLISLQTTVFPRGTTGEALDVLARTHLWRMGLHVTHQSEPFLTLEDGIEPERTLEPGMVVICRPGFVKPDSTEIRVANTLVVREVLCPHNFGETEWLGFDCVTFLPFCQQLVDANLLTDQEKNWLNAYHQQCEALVGSLLFEEEVVVKGWLARVTHPI
ncbi:peptidase M24, structural domain-containing protein [Chytriomyces sp. MP71]|nr:peptidase M24, structural domain-containing protein [Chytriomyces sp. MP71]